MPGPADPVRRRSRRPGPGGSAQLPRGVRIRRPPAPHDGRRPPARPGCRHGRHRGVPPAGGRGARPAEPLAARRCRGRPGGGVVHRVDRRRVRAGGRACLRGRFLRTSASGGGASRAARRHRGPRRPAGPAVTTGSAKPMGLLTRTAGRSRSACADRRDPVGGPASDPKNRMRATVWAWARPAAAAATLTVVVWHLGVGPFLEGVRAVDGTALVAGAGIGVLTTVCCAWRWTIVARGLSLRLSLPAAVTAYYRSAFLNLTLPGGIAGDVHRGVSHGRDVRDVGLALRAVAWERTAGQVVQAILTVAILLALPSPVRSSIPLVVVALLATVIAVVLVARARPGGSSWWVQVRRAIAGDVRHALLARRAWPPIALSSALVVIGHAVTFLIAARTAGAT